MLLVKILLGVVLLILQCSDTDAYVIRMPVGTLATDVLPVSLLLCFIVII